MRQLSDQEVDAAFKRAPAVVQKIISNGEHVEAITAIGGAHTLHIDQIGLLAELNRNMLLGLISPTQFLGELLASNIEESEARQIMGEINEKIFKPLQEQMRSGGGSAQQAPAQEAPSRASYAPAPPPQRQEAPQYSAPPPPPPPPPPARPAMPPPREQRWQPPQISLPPRGAPPPRPPQAPPMRSAQPPAPPRASLPPRGVMPGGQAERLSKPMPAPAWEPPPRQGAPVIARGQAQGRGGPPPNLPTRPPVNGEARSGAQPEDREFHALPPLAKPRPRNEPGDTPPGSYSGDPYRESPE